MKDTLKTIIADQRDFFESASHLIDRDIPQNLIDCCEILVISGIRRSGKSTLLQQIRRNREEKDYYLNFDDDRLVHFTVNDFQTLYELFIELFGVQKTFYFDEIQNVAGWERFVRRLHDRGYKVFITGSNATMLSRELGTHLTGRYVRYELYPFSFKEFLTFVRKRSLLQNRSGTVARAQIKALFNEYFTTGGFPVFVRTKEPAVLKYLFESILYKDIMVRNKLTNEKELLELVFYLSSNVAKLSTYNSLTRTIGVKNASTVKSYLSFLQDSYLLFQIGKYDCSLKKQMMNAKKTYLIDNGLIRRLGFGFSDNTGQLLENLVFIELKRRNKTVYYHLQKRECDFIVCDDYRVSEALQVCAVIENEQTEKREIDGLMEALEAYSLEKGFILTLDAKKRLQINNKTIEIMPVWEWLITDKTIYNPFNGQKI
jgi:predicted AAA+ superfamily ATPase